MLTPIKLDNVTILFADVCNYTKLCEIYPIIDNVMMLNNLFSAFDSYLLKHNIEQVQIIGDGYMAVSGHYNDENNATNMLKFAIDILNEAKNRKIEIRIGISSGDVISAKIGINSKFTSYYGDTVNMASRMESHGYPWCIHVSQMFLDKIITENVIEYNFIHCGYRLIKGKGKTKTYLYCIGNEWENALIYDNYIESKYIRNLDNHHLDNHNLDNHHLDNHHLDNHHLDNHNLDNHNLDNHNSFKYTNNNFIDDNFITLPIKYSSYIHFCQKQSSYKHNSERESTNSIPLIKINNKIVAATILIQRMWRFYKTFKRLKFL